MSEPASVDRGAVIAVDLGGTRYRVAAITAEGKILHRIAERTRVEEGLEVILRRLYESIADVRAHTTCPIVGVGVAAPGPLNPRTGVLYSPPNMPGWDEVHMKERMEKELGLPVSVGNDANVAALGEHRFGAGRGLTDIIYITVSTGIGGGVISGNRLVLGVDGLAGEIGHTTIVADGPPCGCGNRGCLEALASGTAIARRTRELIAGGSPSAVLGLASGDLNRIDAEMVEAAARAGDALATGVFRDAAEKLGIAVVNVVHLFNPEMVIIGGGVSRAGALLFDPVRQVVAQRVMPVFRTHLRIVPVQLDDDAGLLGCVALVVGSGAAC